ncbi:hypothetical protein OGAPHI_002791 [Ogataea philodendri]|uniref:PX domain-containing protein n=2 Tax=Saccharomycotina TaxID=147537 RepID=A0A9P8P877_9ASCO|nr:uncharacterized protein OGAPHI_002791 [Ogataea philodendri]KAH3667142.1 hypothetical protein OGAPHI_002791 [Ogataea philodendri]
MAEPRLSAMEQHFLKKELINLELTMEFNKLSPTYTDTFGLRRFGPPFKMYDPSSKPEMAPELAKLAADGYQEHFDSEFPLLRFVFNEFLVTFPFIKMHLEHLQSPDEFWNKVQVFWEMWRTKKISSSNDRGEVSKRKLMVYKLQALLLVLFNSAIYCTADKEYFSTSEHRNTYKKMNKLTAGELKFEQNDEFHFVNGLDINVIGVVAAKEQKTRYFIASTESSYYNFIIRVRKEDGTQWCVKRRYSQFSEFDKLIGKQFAGSDLPFLPSKTKAKVSLPAVNDIEKESVTEDAVDVGQLETMFLNTLRRSFNEEKSVEVQEDEHEFPRESLRIALRGYLRSLAWIEPVSRSKEFLEFISREPVELTVQEQHEAEQRRQLDYYTELQHFKFQQETVRAVNELETQMEQLKKEVMTDGFAYVFRQLETKSSTKELSKPLQSLIQLVQIEVASTIYELFVGSDNSRETLTLIKRLHHLFPYGLVATILRFTNPLQIVKRLIDLFTFQMPVGFGKKSRSLLQVIFSGVLDDDLKKCEKELDKIRQVVAEKGPKYTALLRKIDEYFTAPDDVVLQVKKTSQRSGVGIFPCLLLNNNGLSTKIEDSILIELLELLKQEKTLENNVYSSTSSYFRTMLRKLDKISLKELWDEPELIDLIKELLAIFFQPLIRLFKSAQMHLYVPVFHRYMNELIQLAEHFQNNHFSSNVVASFMGLQDKYQEDVYDFMHRLYVSDQQQGQGMFSGFLEWFNRFVRFLRFVKDDRPDLELDLNGLGLDEEVKKEVATIVAEVEEKRRQYERLAQQESRAKPRQLEENWDKLNSRIVGLGGADTDLDRLGEYVGVRNEDLVDLNVALAPEDESHGVFSHLGPAQFLAYVASLNVSDEEFAAEDQLGEYKNRAISKLEPEFKAQTWQILEWWNKSQQSKDIT